MAAPSVTKNHRIAPFCEIDWAQLYAINIAETGNPLLRLPENPDWSVRPMYLLEKIPGALRECYLRAEVITRLHKAAAVIACSQWRLCVLDGWRPPVVQKALYERIFHTIAGQFPLESANEWHQRTLYFVSQPSENPTRPSPHLTGASVDVTLIWPDGTPVDMGSGFDEPSPRSYSDAYENTPGQIRDCRRLLHYAMTVAGGFTNLASEWWHFDYGNQSWAYFCGEKCAKFGLAYPEKVIG